MGNEKRIARALAFIEDNLTHDIGVDDIASASCLSPFYFSRLFSSAFLVGPWEWLVRRRISEAAKAISSGCFDITDAALELGFSGPDVFSRSYRRATGVNPAETKRTRVLPRRLLDTPSDEVIALACDSSCRPSVSINVRTPRTFSGITVFSSRMDSRDPSDASRAEAIRTKAIREELLRLSPSGSAYAAARMYPGAADTILEGPSAFTEDSRHFIEGPYAECIVPDLRDAFTAREWFRRIALSVLPRDSVIPSGDSLAPVHAEPPLVETELFEILGESVRISVALCELG